MTIVNSRGKVRAKSISSYLMMATFYDNPSFLSRLLGVVNILGRSFTSVTSVFNIVFMFVCGGDGEKDENGAKSPDVQNTQIQSAPFRFSAFVENMAFLYPEVFVGSGSFKAFDSFCRNQGCTCSAIFLSDCDSCRMCGRKLLVCDDGKDVIVCHMTRGTYIGSRFTKKCSKCKIQEHFGFF